MSLPKFNKQTLFKDAITVDFLHRSYPDYIELAQEAALSEINSIQTAVPIFNTLAALNKSEFNKFMTNLLRKLNHGGNKDGKLYTVVVAGVIDTFTCMIANNKFYDCFEGENKQGLLLMTRLFQSLRFLITLYKVLDDKELKTLIDIVEKSIQRIENEGDICKIMKSHLESLKCTFRNIENEENDFEAKTIKRTSNNNLIKNSPDKILNDIKSKSNLEVDRVTSEIAESKTKYVNFVTTKAPQLSNSSNDKTNIEKKHINAFGDNNENTKTSKKVVNAFDIMMNSKLLTKKRKLAV